MAMTELTLLFIGALATLATMGLFARFGDHWTEVAVTFLASALWGLFGLSAYDVIIDDAATVSEPIMPLVVLGIAMSAIVGLYAFYGLVKGFGSEADEAQMDMMP